MYLCNICYFLHEYIPTIVFSVFCQVRKKIVCSFGVQLFNAVRDCFWFRGDDYTDFSMGNQIRQASYIGHQHWFSKMVGEWRNAALRCTPIRLYHKIGRTHIVFHLGICDETCTQNYVFQTIFLEDIVIHGAVFVKLTRNQ